MPLEDKRSNFSICVYRAYGSLYVYVQLIISATEDQSDVASLQVLKARHLLAYIDLFVCFPKAPLSPKKTSVLDMNTYSLSEYSIW